MTRTPYENIPLFARHTIRNVIVDDEGGWQLNKEDPNDQDGGWTYGGITRKLYERFYQTTMDREYVQQKLSNPDSARVFIESCYVLYHEEFYKDLLEALNGHGFVRDAVFSAAINVGLDDVLPWVKVSRDLPGEFLKLWKDHYIDLVVSNARKWREYGITQNMRAAGKDVAPCEMPKTLRAIYLRGWLNRIDRYR